MRRVAVRVGSAALLVVLSAVLSGCSAPHPAPTVPPPEDVALAYLNAVAAGDATTALSLSEDAGSTNEGRVFLTDAVLGAAVERISDVSVEPVGQLAPHDHVRARFTLAGKSYTTELTLFQNDDGEWILRDSLLNKFRIGLIDGADEHSVGFSLSGVTVAPDVTAPPLYAAYPAVYKLDVDLPSELLTDPATQPLSRDFTVPPVGEPTTINFAVSGFPG